MNTKILNPLLINGLCLVMGWLSMAYSASTTIAKEPPYLEVEVESDEIFVGESTTLQVAVHNADQPSAPLMKPLEEFFDVAFLGDQSLNQSSTMIINGRFSQKKCLQAYLPISHHAEEEWYAHHSSLGGKRRWH